MLSCRDKRIRMDRDKIMMLMMMMLIIIIIIIIIKSLFNVGHIHLQNFHYIAQANKDQPWNIVDIIFTTAFVHNT